MTKNVHNLKPIFARKCMLWMFYLLISIACSLNSGEALSAAVLEKISTHTGDGKSVVEIKLSGYAPHKVIPVDNKELLIAIKDVQLGQHVFGLEAVFGDPFLKQIETAQNPQLVASVVFNLQKKLNNIKYSVKEKNGLLTLEIQDQEKEIFPKTALGDGDDNSLIQGVKWVEEFGRENKKTQEAPSSKPKRAKNLLKDELLLEEAGFLVEKRKWESAISILEDFIETYPESPILGHAYFLLAKSVHGRHAHQIPKYLLDITERYQIAINKFPESKFIPDALVAMGNCYLAAGRYFEAQSKYDRVLAEFGESTAAPEAMFQRGRVFALTKRPLLAIREFEKMEKRFRGSRFIVQAKLELAKALFEIRSFKRSARVLEALKKQDPQLPYKEPAVFLYAGYNYYELGELQEARDALTKVLNYFPDIDAPDLLLTRIADSFREDGMDEKAGKLYDLIARTYPGSEGSLISLLRIAEGVENEGMADDSGESEKKEKRAIRANEIYAQIIAKDPEGPLAQVAMLKLATFQKKNKRYAEAIDTLKELLTKDPNHKLKEQVFASMQDSLIQLAALQNSEKKYEESVSTLKQLLTDFPEVKLMDEVKPVLEASLSSVFNQKRKQGDKESFIKYYEEIDGVVPFEQMPALLLDAANAYVELHLFGHAYSTFLKAKTSLKNDGLPPESLLAFAQCAFEEKDIKSAKVALRSFVNKYPKHKDAVLAQLWLGKVNLSEKEFGKAYKILQASLAQNAKTALEPEILSVMADAATGLGKLVQAEKALARAVDLLEKKEDHEARKLFTVYRRLGEIRSRLGYNEKAVTAYEHALRNVTKGKGEYELQYRLAQCYKDLKVDDKAEQILNNIVKSGDPFWSKLARAQIDEINIGQSVQKLGFKQGNS